MRRSSTATCGARRVAERGDSAKRILVVCQHFWPEAFRINDVCDYFVSNGYEVDVLCGLPNYPSGVLSPGYSWRGPYRERNAGVEIFRVPEIPRKGNSSLRILLNYVSYPVASLLALPRIMFRRYDKVYIYQLSPVMMAWAGIAVGKLKRIEVTMSVLDLWPENLFSVLEIKNRFLRAVATKVSHWHYRRVDKLVALSQLMKARLTEISALPSEKIEVLPQACEKFYEASTEDPVLRKKYQGTFNLVFTGNISPAQSFETMIAAASQLKERGFHRIRWIIVGDGMSRETVTEQVRDAGLSEVFDFVGRVPPESITSYFDIADGLVGCLVKSDLLEATIPAKVLSYVASGRPVLLAMDGEVSDLVQDAQCGFVGPAGDVNQLVGNIERLYAMSDAERVQLGENGRAYHFVHLERNVVLGKLEKFIFAQ